MKKRRVGTTDLYVSELGFGGASIGNLYAATSDEKAHAVIETCRNFGINYFDTAPEYGHGLSEHRLGNALRKYSRQDYFLSTKVGDLLYIKHNQLPPKNKFIDKLPFHLKFDYSYSGIMRAFEDSMQRLGLSHIDLLFVHDLDPVIHGKKKFEYYFQQYLNGGYQALAELREAKIIKAIGFGVKQWQVCDLALREGDYECFMLQGNYTLLEQPALTTFFPVCEKKKISVFLAGPFASGILATGPIKNAYYHHQKAPAEIVKRVAKIEAICNQFDVSLPAAALQFPLKHSVIASVVVGSASAAQMQQNVARLNTNIPKACWHALKMAGFIAKEAPIDD